MKNFNDNGGDAPALVSESQPHGMKENLEITVDADKFNIHHFFIGTNTIREVYEDFLTRLLEHS